MVVIAKIDEMKKKVDRLLSDAGTIGAWIESPGMLNQVRSLYERWYMTALRLVGDNLSAEELTRFVEAYDSMYTQQYLMAEDPSSYKSHFSAIVARQKGIVAAIPDVIEVKALALRNLAVGDVLGDEMEKARFLLEQGLVREAGVIGGIALEGHLKLLHTQFSLEYSPSDSMVDLAKRLRKQEALMVGDEKKVGAMAITRNKCAHKADEEPTFEEVEDFLDDVERFIKRTSVG